MFLFFKTQNRHHTVSESIQSNILFQSFNYKCGQCGYFNAIFEKHLCYSVFFKRIICYRSTTLLFVLGLTIIAENNTITMRDRKINFRSLTLLDQGIFLITFDQFMNAPYNRYSKSKCLIQSGGLFKCKFDKLHKCSFCTRFGCALYQHNSDAQFNLLSTPDTSEINHQITSTINEGFDKLSTKLTGLTSTAPDSTSSISGVENENLPMFGMPSVISNTVDLPNLSNQHIMWCKVKSGRIDISLPLDSCCSVSLFSLEHAKLIQEKHPSFTWVKLPFPKPIHVAKQVAGLQGVGMQDVRTEWGPGKHSLHRILVVPKLSSQLSFFETIIWSLVAQSCLTKNALFISDTQQCNLRLSAHRSHPIGPMAPLKPISFHCTFILRNHRSCSVASILLLCAFHLPF